MIIPKARRICDLERDLMRGTMDIASPNSSWQDRQQNEQEEDDRIDCSPSVKERAKTISLFSVKSFMFLHSMDWGSYDNFVSKFTTKAHQNDISALVEIGKADRFCNVGNHIAACENLKQVERWIYNVDLPQALVIRYLTSKAYILKMKGECVESKYLLSQAVQLALSEQASNATAFCHII